MFESKINNKIGYYLFDYFMVQQQYMKNVIIQSMDAEIEQQNVLTILHFNDVYDIEPDANGMHGFVNFYNYVLHLKAQYPQSILVFSGDAFAPSKLSRIRKGWQMAHCLKKLKIDVACYGNHDFDYLPEHALELAKQCQVPWLLANVKYKDSSTNLGEALDYYIIQRSGFKIGFIGLAGPDFKGRLISAYKDKLDYENPNTKAKKLCTILKEKECNLIIALTHMRIPADDELAKSVPQIDIILGGHDHVVLSKMVNKTPLLKSGKNFEHIGIYKIFPHGYQQKISHKGRNWSFQFNCPSITKSHTKYPQLQNYIQKAVKQYKERGIAKPKQAAIKKNQKQKMKQKLVKQWKLSYDYVNGKVVLQIQSNLLSQICFAKSLSFHKQIFFCNVLKCDTLLQDTEQSITNALEFIEKQMLKLNKKFNTLIYGTGFTSLTYIIECFDFMYLPNQLSCNVSSIQQLQRIMKFTNMKGISCFGVIQFISSNLNLKTKINDFTTKIVLSDIPDSYKNIIRQKKIKNIINIKFNKESTQFIKQLLYIEYPPFNGEKQYINYYECGIKQKDTQMLIYQKFKISNEQYLLQIQKYTQFLNKNICAVKICNDKVKSYIISNILNKTKNMNVEQSGNQGYNGDIIIQQKQNIQKKQQIKSSSAQEEKTISLKKQQQTNNLNNQNYKMIKMQIFSKTIHEFELINAKIAYEISKQHIKLNRSQVQDGIFKGLVFNQDQFCNPTYELVYGYVPILFAIHTYQNSKALDLISKQQLQSKRWFNIKQDNFQGYLSQKNWRHPVYDLLKRQNKTKDEVILKNNKRKLKTLQWVTKYSKNSYADVQPLPENIIFDLFNSLSKQFDIQFQYSHHLYF